MLDHKEIGKREGGKKYNIRKMIQRLIIIIIMKQIGLLFHGIFLVKWIFHMVSSPFWCIFNKIRAYCIVSRWHHYNYVKISMNFHGNMLNSGRFVNQHSADSSALSFFFYTKITLQILLMERAIWSSVFLFLLNSSLTSLYKVKVLLRKLINGVQIIFYRKLHSLKVYWSNSMKEQFLKIFY